MDINEEKILSAIRDTEVLKFPKQLLATFGTTNVRYYLLTSPVYADLVDKEETVVREGRVSAERPRLVTFSYLTKLDGFGENARRYIDMVIKEYGPNAPGLLYRYKNESTEMTIVSEEMAVVAGKLKEKIDRDDDKLAAVIKGVDEMWDVSLIKFISEMTEGSLRSNIEELGRNGLLGIDQAGVPSHVRHSIEILFGKVSKGEYDPSELKKELDRWGVFSQYEDRFLGLFRKE